MDDDVLYFDDFTDPTSGWETGAEDGLTREYTSRGYRLHVPEADRWLEVCAGLEVDDFSVEVEIVRGAGPEDGAFGVVARASEAGAYAFQLDGEGYYGIYKDTYGDSEDEDIFVTLAEGHAPGLLNTALEAENHVRAVCRGPHLSLYLNGQLTLEAEDADYPSGDVGLLAAAGESGRGGLEVFFNRFVVRQVN